MVQISRPATGLLLCLVFGACLAVGCADRPEDKANEALAAIDLESLHIPAHGGYTPSELAAKRILAQQNVRRIAVTLVRLFTEAQDPAIKAKAVTALRLCVLSEGAETEDLKGLVLSAARRGVADPSPTVALCSLRVLRDISDGNWLDRLVLAERSRVTHDCLLLTHMYDTLYRWGEEEWLWDRLSQPCPGPGREYEQWYVSTQSILNVLNDTSKWRRRKMSQSLIESLVALMAQDREFIRPAAWSLVHLKLKEALPGLKALYDRTRVLEDRILLGAAITVIDPELPKMRSDLSELLAQLVTQASLSSECGSTLINVNGWLMLCVRVNSDESLMKASWRCYKPLSPALRAQLLERSLVELLQSETLVLGLLSQVSDDELREMVLALPVLREILKHLFSETHGVPVQGSALRKAAEERLITLYNEHLPGAATCPAQK
ncbi:MAG: hypothetical protein FJ288_10335 [Planctomycetes bacterium]|nr:hypothetical protein [Planctomycetota bacterium]